MEYKIVDQASLKLLERDVNQWCAANNGFEPFGNIVIEGEGSQVRYIQAMIKRLK